MEQGGGARVERRTEPTPESTEMKPILTLTTLAFLAACNTVAGFGQDVQNAGDAINEEATEQQGACIDGELADGTPC
jgi:predicted small secreted protein